MAWHRRTAGRRMAGTTCPAKRGTAGMGRIAAGTRDSATAITCGQITAGDRAVTVMEWT